MHARLILIFCCLFLLTGFVIKRGSGGAAGTPGVPCASLYIENPTGGQFDTVVHFDQNVKISRIVCQCRGGTNIVFAWGIDGVALDSLQSCTTADGVNDTTIDGVVPVAGDDIDLLIFSVTPVNEVDSCSMMLFCT